MYSQYTDENVHQDLGSSSHGEKPPGIECSAVKPKGERVRGLPHLVLSLLHPPLSLSLSLSLSLFLSLSLSLSLSLLADCLLWYFLCYTPYHTCFCDLSNSSFLGTLTTCLTDSRLYVDSERWDCEVRLSTFNWRKSGLTWTVVMELSELFWKFRGHHPANYHSCGDYLERTNLKIRNSEGRSIFIQNLCLKRTIRRTIFILLFLSEVFSSCLLMDYSSLIYASPSRQGRPSKPLTCKPMLTADRMTEWKSS